ncbi:MAG: ABC transporter ATP-binding protein [Acidimicrobiales bacterium]
MRERLRNLRAMVGISWRADRLRSVTAALTTAAFTVSWTVGAVGMAWLVNGVATGKRSQALAGVVFLAALAGAQHLLEWANQNTRMRLREHTIAWLDQRVMSLAAGLPGLEHHERADYQDRMDLLRRQRGSLVNPFLPLAWMVANIVQFAVAVLLLARLSPLMFVLPVAALPSVWAGARSEALWKRLFDEQAEDERRLRHLFELATLPDAAKEVRLLGLREELGRRHRRTFDALERARVRTAVRTSLLKVGGWLCFGVAYLGVLLFVVRRTVDGSLSVGGVVLTLSLGAMINGQLGGLVSNATWVSRTTQAVTHYRWLEDHAAAVHAATPVPDRVPTPMRLTGGITLRGLGFRYPGTDAPVLSDVDLHIPAGTTVAVVGENGAGKTTLVKLLLRFYEPSEGCVQLDGIDLRRFDVDAWRACTSASFQDFARFQLVAGQAVGVGLLRELDSEVAVLGALARGGGGDLCATLPQRLRTQLGRDFEGGIELSTGQWQKVALGRTMMREAPLLLVLDEPTASLDALTEHALFERFASQAKAAGDAAGTVTVLVSHRFSTVRMADLIIVIERGRVIECGSHDELMARAGRYAELYGLQARGYA